jgi:tRNA pseudouridine32 synthase / 23S rRNA pseudouridine746 synthase
MKIIYEDSDILVINKPSGVISIADGYNKEIPHLRTLLEPEYGRLWIVHRLDKETSGVMILARNAQSHKILDDQFAVHSIKKEYAALVFGAPPYQFSDSSLLLVDGDRRHRTVVDASRGKPAQTDFTSLETLSATAALISARPQTGFSHQIRAHLLHSGYPILGDLLYASPESKRYTLELNLLRVALHACTIYFVHPTSGLEVSFSADYPDDFIDMMNLCKRKEHQPG